MSAIRIKIEQKSKTLRKKHSKDMHCSCDMWDGVGVPLKVYLLFPRQKPEYAPDLEVTCSLIVLRAGGTLSHVSVFPYPSAISF